MATLKPLLTLGIVGLIAIACQSAPEQSGPDPEAPIGSSPIVPVVPTADATSPPSAAPPPPPAPAADLKTYADAAIPITAQYPDPVKVTKLDTPGQIGLTFTFDQPELATAQMQVALPTANPSPVEIEQAITHPDSHPDSLFAAQGWRVLEDSALVKRFNYPWVRTVVAFSAGADTSGAIILGEISTQTVQLTMLYPNAYAEDYWINANIILSHLSFNTEQLPISPR